MSGFFMFRREMFDNAEHNLSDPGFKILLDLSASSSRPLRVRELPFVLRESQHGESKLDVLLSGNTACCLPTN
jgi:dolichol-phosphate mannosyltransferase